MFAKSISGPKYIAKGWECQDSSGICQIDHDTQAISLADGHGSSDCFRSEVGSKAAVKATFHQLQLFCKNACDERDPSVRFSETGIANLKYSIWSEWRKLVKEDWNDRLTSHETLGDGEIRYESVSEKYKSRFTSNDESTVEQYLYSAYGTTLIFAVSIKTQMLIMQIGDGSCVVLQQNGEFRNPVPPDEENFLNVTVSLCEENAYQKIRHIVLDCDPNSPTTPVAVFLSSDGVDDCFPVYMNELHLGKLYSIILENIQKVGFTATETEIADKLLPGMTAKGSQDDISLSFFVCEDIEMLTEAYRNVSESLKPREDSDKEQNPESDKNNTNDDKKPDELQEF